MLRGVDITAHIYNSPFENPFFPSAITFEIIASRHSNANLSETQAYLRYDQFPGLFISDRFAARSLPLLRSLNITHVLSVTRPEDAPKFHISAPDNDLAPSNQESLVSKQINIDDDPLEDLLCHLKDACDRIQNGLQSTTANSEGNELKQVGVLVHCVQGISRSESIIVAYLLRTFSLEYSTALSLARESRSLITPNSGFKQQLLVWEKCEYDVYSADSVISNSQEKAEYKVWKKNRDAFFSMGEEAVNKARAMSMAKTVAAFGKRRFLKEVEKKKEEGEK